MHSFILLVYAIFLESNWNLAHHPQAAEAPPLPALAGTQAFTAAQSLGRQRTGKHPPLLHSL